MQAAMETVKRELGSDAVILSSRKTRRKGIKNLVKKRVLEVMVAYEPEKVPLAKFSLNGYAPPTVPESAPPKREEIPERQPDGDVKLKQLDDRLESLDSIISGLVSKLSSVSAEPARAYTEDVEAVISKLTGNEVLDELAYILARDAEDIISRQPDAPAVEVFEQLIIDMMGAPAPITAKKFAQKTVLAVGPTGVGKTTSIVKLAAHFALKQKRKVGIINTDTYRIGANEQLKTYTDILSIPFAIVYQIDELREAIDGMADRDVIFIDTAGKKPGDIQHRDDVLEIMRIAQPEDTLLCVSASTSFSALREIIDTYGFVDDFKLVVTKLDETKFRGVLLNLRWYAKKQLAYITTGQNVPDDIGLVDAEKIAGQLLG
jgi:flagellar biosynthesis protein FlhF